MTKPRLRSAPPRAAQDTRVERVETVRPPFDPEEFARQSESNMRIADTQPPSGRPTAPPPANLPQYAPGITSGTIASLGSVTSDAIPVLAVAREDLEWFDLAQAARDVLAHVDGRATIATIGARSGVTLDQVMSTVHELTRDAIVTLRR